MGFRVLWLIFLGFASSLSSIARCNWTVSPDERILKLGMHVGHVLTHPLRVGVFDSTFLFISSFGDFLYLTVLLCIYQQSSPRDQVVNKPKLGIQAINFERMLKGLKTTAPTKSFLLFLELRRLPVCCHNMNTFKNVCPSEAISALWNSQQGIKYNEHQGLL